MPANRAKTIFGFFLLPLITMAVSFFSIPVLVRVSGASGWTAVAVAQGVGATAALLIQFGWGTVGPAIVAGTDREGQHHLYWLSSIMRGVLFIVTAPIAASAAVMLVESRFAHVAAVVSTAYALQALSPNWYLTGQARPFAIAFLETIPRSCVQLVAMVVLITTKQLLWYALLLILVEVVICGVSYNRLARRNVDFGPLRPQLVKRFREQWPLVGSTLIGIGYTRAAVPIVSAVAYPAAAAFASLDRMHALSRTGIRPLISYFQGWVPGGPDQDRPRRAKIATIATVGLGAAVGGALAAFLPLADEMLFGDAIRIDWLQSSLLGAVILLVSISYCTTLFYLVPSRKIRFLSITSSIGSLTAVPLILVLTPKFGAAGAVGAIGVAEALVVIGHVTYLLISRPGRVSKPGPVHAA